MDPLLLTIIIVLGLALLAVTSYMEWIGVMNLFTARGSARYSECGHVRFNRSDPYDECWSCRHPHLGHPSKLIHH